MTVTTFLRQLNLRQRLGLGLFGMVLAFALFGGLVSDADPAKQNLSLAFESPSLAHPFGTDHFGRSMLARLVAATRLSLGLALICVLSAAIAGTLLGFLAAWRGGWIDRVLSGLADALVAIPGLLIVLLVAAFAPGAYWPLYLGLSLVLWIEYFRIVRAQASVLISSPQVEAASLLGFGPLYVFRNHIVPEIGPIIGTLMAFGSATAILSLAALGFVGVGLRPPTAEWGIMMTELLPYYDEAPWLIASPILLLVMTVLGLSLLAGKDAR